MGGKAISILETTRNSAKNNVDYKFTLEGDSYLEIVRMARKQEQRLGFRVGTIQYVTCLDSFVENQMNVDLDLSVPEGANLWQFNIKKLN